MLIYAKCMLENEAKEEEKAGWESAEVFKVQSGKAPLMVTSEQS